MSAPTRPTPPPVSPPPATGGSPWARRAGRFRGKLWRDPALAGLPRAPLSPARASMIATFGTVTALAVWFILYALVFSGLQESHSQHVLYTQLRSGLASETIPFGGVIDQGSPIALISAPSIGLRSVVVEGTSSKELTKGPGHLPSSPLPGQAGVSVIFGRSATFGSPFAKLAALRTGATVTVTTGQGTFGYQVKDVRRPGDPGPAQLAANASGLTLVTSSGSGWRSGWAPTQVVYVDASLVTGKVQPAPAGRPTVSPDADQVLAGDTNNLVPLVLWLQAMVLVAAGLVYAHTKLTGLQLWLIGTPLAVAVLWGTTSTTLLLLPNLA